MKSFVIALFLLLFVILFVVLNTAFTVRAIDEMISLADTVPLCADDIRFERDGETVRALSECWDAYFPYIAFTAGYTNTERCDEALGALTVHFQNRNAPDFIVSLSEFRDALLRLRILEGFHIEGIL